MRRTACLLGLVTALALSTSANAALIIVDDTAPGSGAVIATGGASLTTIADPSDGSNQVGLFSVDGSAGFVGANPGPQALPASAQGAPFTFTVDVTVPQNTNGSAEDSIFIQIDFDGSNSGSAGFISPTAIAGSGPQTLTLSGSVPATATTVNPLFVYGDGGFSGTASAPFGDILFLDNYRFEIDAPAVPEPTTLVLSCLAAMAIAGRRMRA